MLFSSTLNYTMPIGKDLEVSLTITAANGQQATDYQFVMNLFFGGGPCTACPDITLEDLDVNPATQNKTKLAKVAPFPNPSSNQLKVILPKQLKGNIKLLVTDLNGAVMVENLTKGSGQLHSMDIAGLREGIYILKVISDNTVQSIRFIKE